MSEGDVSQIRDEDVLRRLWQQTEDFSRKKEIRAHMYRLREERLRDLYTPEPLGDGNKGCEFTSPQGHVQSFADQTFQSMKSKEVRDAGSPPKEFTYCGQDLKALSNAGWNVESENRITDDGHTHVKTVNANIEGRYDVDGGKGQFAAIDQHTQAATEYQDGNSSLQRNETSSSTAAHEQVMRKTEDGSHFSSTKSSSSTSKFEQVSTKHETVPYTDDYDQHTINTNRREQPAGDNYEHTLRKTDNHGELMSRKVDYPDDNTRVIVETRRLPDGTRVTSTRREFRAPVQSTRSEHHSQSRSENNYSTTHRSDQTLTSKSNRHLDNSNDIVDSQRKVDNYDFRRQNNDDDVSETQSVRNYETHSTRRVIDTTNEDNYSTSSRLETSKVTKNLDKTNIDKDCSTNQHETINKVGIERTRSDDVDVKTTREEINKQQIDQSSIHDNYSQTTRYVTKIKQVPDQFEDSNRPDRRPDSIDNVSDQTSVVRYDINEHQKDVRDTEEKIRTTQKNAKDHVIDRKTITEQHQTTYYTDYTQKKISTDWSPSHQAWASTLRSDTPPTTRPSTRASSPGSKTFKSSSSSLRSSVSPDKSSRKPSSRGNSPNKIDRYSPSRSTTDRYSSTQTSHSVTEVKSTKHTNSAGRPPTGRSPTRPGDSPDRKPSHQRPSVSPDKSPHNYIHRPTPSPERKPLHKSNDIYPSSTNRPSEVSVNPRQSPDRQPGYQPTSVQPGASSQPRMESPQRNTSDKKPDGPQKDFTRVSPSPEKNCMSDTPTDCQSTPFTDVPKTTSHSITYYHDDPHKRQSVSPERKPKSQPEKATHKTPQRQNASPERKPGFKKSNTDSQPNEYIKSPTKLSINPNFTTNKNSINIRENKDNTRTTKVKEDHYKFIDEETKIYTKTDKVDKQTVNPDHETHQEKSPSPIRKIFREETPENKGTPWGTEPFKQHGQKTTTFDENRINKYDSKYISETVTKIKDVTNHTSKSKYAPEPGRESSPSEYKPYDQGPEEKDKPRKQTNRDVSPTKYGTYDKKKQQNKVPDSKPKDEHRPKSKIDRAPPSTNVDISDKKITRHDSIISSNKHNDKPDQHPDREMSPTKYGTYDKKYPQDKEQVSKPKDEHTLKSQSCRETSPSQFETFNVKHPHKELKDFSPKDKNSPGKHPREPSPTKHDKTAPYNICSPKDSYQYNQTTNKREETIVTSNDIKDTNHNSLNRKKIYTKHSPEQPTSPTKKTPRDSVSPLKSPTKESKYKQTTDFLSTERTTEEINKKTKAKDHPRQLITPSSSPTRKYKPETESSTGHSSPTTSVSGFIYFGSPPREKLDVTDLDKQNYYSETSVTSTQKTSNESDTLNVHRSPSPSKIPCRSPSPEKHTATNKEKLPRKSSLKKPSEQFYESPTENPPSSFHISRSDSQDYPHNRTVKKDHSEPEEEEVSLKPKTPLERRETYEERCKKILGMIDVTESIIQQTTLKNNTDSTLSSPSVSPCESPVPRDISPHKENPIRKDTVDVIEFITNEKEAYIKTTRLHDMPADKTGKTLTPKSQANLPEFITETKSVDKHVSKTSIEENNENLPIHKQQGDCVRPGSDFKITCTSLITEKTTAKKPDLISENRLEHEIHLKDRNNTPKESSPSRTSLSPVRKPNNASSKNIKTSTVDVQESRVTDSVKSKHSKPYESPSWESPKTIDDHTRSISPSKHVTRENSPKKNVSPINHSINDTLTKQPENVYPQTSSSNKPESIPNYMKTTASVTSRQDTYDLEDIESPTRKTPEYYKKNDILQSKTPKNPEQKDQTSSNELDKYSIDNKRISNLTKKESITIIKDLQEDSLTETVKEKYSDRPSKSPTRNIPEEYKTNDITHSNTQKKAEQRDYRQSSPTKAVRYPIENKKNTTLIKQDTITTNQNSQEETLVATREEGHSKRPLESPKCKTPENYKPNDISQSNAHKYPEQKNYRQRSPTKSDKSADYKSTTILTKKDTTTVSENLDENTLVETVEKRYARELSESPTRKSQKKGEPKNISPTRSKIVKENTLDTRNENVPLKISIGEHSKESSPASSKKTPGYIKTTTAYTSKYDTAENIDKASNKTTNIKSSTSSGSPVCQLQESKIPGPDYPSSNYAIHIAYPEHNTPMRSSLSPERKSEHSPTILAKKNKVLDDSNVNELSQIENNTSHIKTTTTTTKKQDTTFSSQDIEETVTSKTVHKKHTNQFPKTDVDDTIKILSEESRKTLSGMKNTSPVREVLKAGNQPINQQSSPRQPTSPKKLDKKYSRDLSPPKPPIATDHTETTSTYVAETDVIEETSISNVIEESPKSTGYPKSTTRKGTSPDGDNGVVDKSMKEVYKHSKDTSPAGTDKKFNTDTLVSSKTESHKHTFTQYDSPEYKSDRHYPKENSPHTSRRPSRKSPIRDHKSPEKEPLQEKLKRPFDETLKKKREDKMSYKTSPSRSENVSGYENTTTITSKYDASSETDNIIEIVEMSHKTTKQHLPSRSTENSPSRQTEDYNNTLTPKKSHHSKSIYPESSHTEESKVSERNSLMEQTRETSPVRRVGTTNYIKSTIDITTKHIDDEPNALRTIEKKQTPRPVLSPTSKITKPYPGHLGNRSPTKSYTKDVSPLGKPASQQSSTPRDSPTKKPTKEDIYPKVSTPMKPEDKKPGFMRPTSSSISKYETTSVEDLEEYTTFRATDNISHILITSPERYVPEEASKPELTKPEEIRQLRTPSPIKKVSKVTDASSDFISSEREQEIIDRVQKSLRTLSPDRRSRSPSLEMSSAKTKTSLHDLDIKKTIDTTDFITDETIETTYIAKNIPHSKHKEEKYKEPKSIFQPRTVSPLKKVGMTSPVKSDKGPESPTKSRSISPKKAFGERPQSPQVVKNGRVKPKEQVPIYLTRKPTPITITTTKIEKAITMDVKKTFGATKQNISKTSVKATASKFISPTKPEPETKRTGTPRAVKESNKKDTDTKVTRSTIEPKKISPHHTKSKPEIQVNYLPTPKTSKSNKEPQTKFPGKPKSATSLNTSTDEDDIIIDVQQSKSSRENSPDRICPTPVNFTDDVGTPRFPDQVSEPDDDLRKRTHHTIHETESLVDDIVEIREEDELFIKKTIIETSDLDESLLSVHDKVSKFTNKIETVSKPTDSSTLFKDIEIKNHSDVFDDNIKSDECLLSVSEKVNKFAKGPRDSRDSKSPSRRIVEEYDKHTIYQDDYTKLSVNDKAHLFVETAENVKSTKIKPAQKAERPDLSNVDESLKSDDCLLSVSDKVNKFVKTAEQFLVESHEVEEKDKKIKEQHDKLMRQIVGDHDDETTETTKYIEEIVTEIVDSDARQSLDYVDEKSYPSHKAPTPAHPKDKDHSRPKSKPVDQVQTVKVTSLRSSEAVKKAKALFENIASTTQKPKESPTKPTTKLTDIGIKNAPKTDTRFVSRSTVADSTTHVIDSDTVFDAVPQDHNRRPSGETPSRQNDTKHHSSPSRVIIQTPHQTEAPRSKSPVKHTVETTTIIKTVVAKQPAAARAESPKHRLESDKPDKIPGYLRPTKTSQIKEEKVTEEHEVSSRRGSGKFGVELRRTSIDRTAPASERRRSIEHPCIEDIFDLDLLEQMLEKVVGYEQRRRIRAQIRVARKGDESNTFTKSTKSTLTTQQTKSSESHKSPVRSVKSPQKTMSPERKAAPNEIVNQPRAELITNGDNKEQIEITRIQRPDSPEKITPKSSKSSSRQPSPEKKTRPQSPAKTTSKPKPSRFNEYATAYMKKVGLNETSKPKTIVTNKTDVHKTSKHVEKHSTIEKYSTAKFITERTSSKNVIKTIEENGKRSASPDKRRCPETKPNLERTERSPSPGKRNSDAAEETTINTVYDIEKKAQPVEQERKPSWVTNRNLKKVTSESRTFSQKKIEPERPKHRAISPSKVISKPIDAITSSYGPGPLDSDGKPLFGIRALRNGASNYQVKGTVIRQEFHSRNGSEPEGTVSVTAYSTEPEELEKLLQSQGAPPSRLHGLAAITTTKKFGGDSGTTIQQAHGKEERAALEQFTHSDRRVSDFDLETVEDNAATRRCVVEEIEDNEGGETVYRERMSKKHRTDEQIHERKEKMEVRGDKKTVRQNSVKSLTEKYIKSANESAKPDRSSYPKAGLILRTATMKDSISSDSSAHAGLARTNSEQSLGSVDDTVVTTTTECVGDGVRTTTTTTTKRHHEHSFLDNSSKVTGVQDILTRMKNADIVIQEGDTMEDSEARALLNKFLGASVLMAGMQGYVSEKPSGKIIVKEETVRSSGGKVTGSRNFEEIDLDQCWDERELRRLLEECTDYEQRRQLRARIRTLMAEQEACASAVTEALAAAEETGGADGGDTREESEVTVTSSVRRDSSEKTVSSTTTTKTSKVVESVTRPAGKPVSPFAKFRQLEKQNSTTSPNSPKTPQSPGSPSKPYFKFTDPALQASALTIKERLLQWCRDETRDYENVKLENFSTSWADGLAFCALLHHFLPNAFDYSQLTPDKRRHNFTLAFKIADEKAGIYPLLDVDDMVSMRKPDWKCVFTYVQSIHRRFKDQD